MSTKLYTYSVPVTITAIKRIYVLAETEAEAIEKLEDIDWYDSSTDCEEEEYEFDEATLDETQNWEEVE